jgi:hypothetical protein
LLEGLASLGSSLDSSLGMLGLSLESPGEQSQSYVQSLGWNNHTGAIARPARTPTIGSSVVARVAGRAGVAWIVAGFTGFVAGEVKWSERVAGIITGAITRSARTPTSGSSVIARVAGRATVAWIVAGFTGLVAGEVKCSERVAGIITGAIKQSK